MKISSFLFGNNLNELVTIILTENLITKKYKFTIHTIRQSNEAEILKEGGTFDEHIRIHEKEGGF